MVKLLSAIAVTLALVSTTADATAKVDTKAKARNSEQKYCIQFEPDTGSRIAKTDCRTKAEWRDLGIDVDQLAKK